MYIHAFVPESKDRRPRPGSQFRKVVSGSDEWSRVVYLGYRTKGWRQPVFAPFRRDAEKGVPDRVGDVAAEERNGHEQPVAFTVRRDISTCLSSAPTRNMLQSPNRKIFARATDYRATRSTAERRRARRWTIYRRVSAETESFMLARIARDN